jgi:hypothetical protein
MAMLPQGHVDALSDAATSPVHAKVLPLLTAFCAAVACSGQEIVGRLLTSQNSTAGSPASITDSIVLLLRLVLLGLPYEKIMISSSLAARALVRGGLMANHTSLPLPEPCLRDLVKSLLQMQEKPPSPSSATPSHSSLLQSSLVARGNLISAVFSAVDASWSDTGGDWTLRQSMM